MIRVVRVTDEIADPVAAFFREVWKDGSTGESVRQALARNGRSGSSALSTDAIAVAYLDGDRVLGYLGTIPTRFWNGETETPGHWLKGFMVLPEHRNGPVGFSLLRELLKHLGPSGATVVALPARRLFEAVGYVDCGTLPNHLTPLRPAAIARRIDIASIGLGLSPRLGQFAHIAQRFGVASALGGLAGVGLTVARAVRGMSRGVRLDVAGRLPETAALDELWQRARAGLEACGVRDGAFLSTRYDPRLGGLYQAASAFDTKTGRLGGVAVVRRPSETPDARLKGIHVATLSDAVFEVGDHATALALVRGAEVIARRMGAEALLCSSAHPALTGALRRRAWLRLPGNLHLMMREGPTPLRMPTAVERWWATRGDGAADEAF